MAAALKSGNFTGRVLGKSESISVPNRPTMLMTGNNLSLPGYMARRVLFGKTDPRTERPFVRQFHFDTLAYAQLNRQSMIVAALTIARDFLTSGANRVHRRMASFELWDDLVRQLIALGGREIQPEEFADPINAVIGA